MKSPFIITNFKVYQSSLGEKAIDLAKAHEKVAQETNTSLGVAVSALDIRQVCKEVNIPVFAQHIDIGDYGQGTGKIPAAEIKDCGAIGTLINHSEYRLEKNVLEASIAKAKEVGLITLVCAKDPKEGEMIAKEFNPDYIAVEPPELIGGDISVSTAQPEIIEDASKRIGSEKLVVGAGVKNSQDVKIALELGSCGILLASGVTKAENPEEVLKELIQGL